MTILGDNLKSARKALKMSQAEVANILRKKYNLKSDRVMVSKWETGFQTPNVYTIKCLAEIYGITMDELNSDTPTEITSKCEHIFELYSKGTVRPKLVASDIGTYSPTPITKQDNDILTYDNIYPIEMKKFPLLGEVACGKPIFSPEDADAYVVANSDIKADFALQARGDSMINARIYDGDMVFIHEQPVVENGEIAAVAIDNEVTLKHVYYYPEQGKLILTPENPMYEPMVYIGEELNSIRILGKAVAFMSNI